MDTNRADILTVVLSEVQLLDGPQVTDTKGHRPLQPTVC